MSRWILKSPANEREPIPFERLAQLLADGKIEETDQLRSEHSDRWQTVDSVIGLCRAASRLRSSMAVTADRSGDITARSECRVPGTQTRHPTRAVETPARERIIARPADSDDPVAESRPPVLAKQLSWWRVMLAMSAIGLVSWSGWSRWIESRRFPEPAHIARNPQTFTLPLIGAATMFEVILLIADMIAIVAFGVWWISSKHKS